MRDRTTGHRLVDQPSAPRYRRGPATRPVPVQQAPVVRRRHRRIRPLLGAMLAVLGLTAVSGLPAVADGYTEAPPPVAADVQHFQAPDGQASSLDAFDVSTGSMVVVPQWRNPAVGRLNDGFGPRPNAPVAGVSAFHRGQDVTVPCGVPVHAAAAGRVVQAGWFGTYGNWVLVDHGDGVQTGYAHESSIGVRVGQVVREGEVIGRAGSTGASTGCHVHVEVHVNGTAIDPVPFFRAKSVPLGG